MKLFLFFTLIVSLALALLFGLQLIESTDISRERLDVKGEARKSLGWEEMSLPADFSPSAVAFGEKGEIVLIGNDIRVSKDNGKTWKIITEGKGYNRCSADGGKTFDKECDAYHKNPSTIKFDGDVNYLGDIRSPVLTSDGRLYLSGFYEHHGALWSIPLENSKESWFGLHFTYDDDPNEMKYWTMDDFFTLKNKVFVSADSAVDDNFKWLTTDDNGKSWHKAEFNLSSDQFFVDENTGIRIIENQFEKTTDGRKNWRILITPRTPDATLSDVFIDDKSGFACGENGMLAVTKDGGNSWRKINLNIAETFHVVTALDERNAWVAGGKGYVFETSDGGETWQLVELDFRKDIYSTFYAENIKVDKFHRTVWIIKDEKIYRKTIE